MDKDLKESFLICIGFLVFVGTAVYFGIEISNFTKAKIRENSERLKKRIDSCKKPMLFKTDTFNSRHTLYSYVCQDSNVIIVSKPILGAKISPYLK